ncbi:MAG: hypothetical protein AAF211_30800, partial [Myxococcota bacterium]
HPDARPSCHYTVEWSLEGCRLDDLSEDERRIVLSKLGDRLAELPPEARVTTSWIDLVVCAIGPGPGDVVDRFYQLDLPSPAAAQDVASRLAPEDMARLSPQTRYAPPLPWPIHPDSPNDHQSHPTPTWWPALGTAGRFALWQRPAELEPCSNHRVSGQVIGVVGRRVFAHRWYRQWFFPDGGCGG